MGFDVDTAVEFVKSLPIVAVNFWMRVKEREKIVNRGRKRRRHESPSFSKRAGPQPTSRTVSPLSVGSPAGEPSLAYPYPYFSRIATSERARRRDVAGRRSGYAPDRRRTFRPLRGPLRHRPPLGRPTRPSSRTRGGARVEPSARTSQLQSSDQLPEFPGYGIDRGIVVVDLHVQSPPEASDQSSPSSALSFGVGRTVSHSFMASAVSGQRRSAEVPSWAGHSRSIPVRGQPPIGQARNIALPEPTVDP